MTFTSRALVVAAVLTPPLGLDACTTAVFSGRATVDGRPMLWKNRDSKQRWNEVAILEDGRFRVIGIVNEGKRDAVLIGTNSAGFSIQNSLAKDLVVDEERSLLRNGAFMKRALQTCATVDDFRILLQETNGVRHTAANFGAIDAHGGAAMFEASSSSFTMFDANDLRVAPHGYIVRSNFSATAHRLPAMPDHRVGSDFDTYRRFSHTCQRLAAFHDVGIGVKDIVRSLSRDMSDESGQPYPGTVNAIRGALPPMIPTDRTISRSSTVSAGIVHGVKPGEDPLLTTLWAILGDPKFSVAVPCWGGLQEIASPLRGRASRGESVEIARDASIGDIAIWLRDRSMDGRRHQVSTTHLTSIWRATWPVEDSLLMHVGESLQKWRSSPPSPMETQDTHRQAAEKAIQAMHGAVTSTLATTH